MNCCHGRRTAVANQVQRARDSLGNVQGLPVGGLLPAEQVEAALEAEGVHCRKCLYTPLVTLWLFLGQVLAPDGSCRAAVCRLLAFLAGRGEASDDASDPVKTNPVKTDPYCKARKRLPEQLVSRLARESARGCTAATPRRPACWAGGR